ITVEDGMTRVITRPLKEDQDGIPGYIAFPEREEKGPGLLLIHQHSGLTGYLKTAAYRFARLGYTTLVPNLYHMLGYPAETHIDKGRRFKTRHPTRILFELLTRVGGMFARVMTLTLHASESLVIAWVGGWVSTSSPRPHQRGLSSPIIPLLPTNRRRASGRATLAML